HRHANPMPAEEIDRRPSRLTDEVEGARKQRGHRAGPRHGARAIIIRILQMIGRKGSPVRRKFGAMQVGKLIGMRSEEHTSELQSRENLVCRLLLEKKNSDA